ncbi:hypothetical protein D3C75_531180 [compost metagenome]
MHYLYFLPRLRHPTGQRLLNMHDLKKGVKAATPFYISEIYHVVVDLAHERVINQ